MEAVEDGELTVHLGKLALSDIAGVARSGYRLGWTR
jgi:hypothetical protein